MDSQDVLAPTLLLCAALLMGLVSHSRACVHAQEPAPLTFHPQQDFLSSLHLQEG